MGYNWAKKKMKKILIAAILLMGIGTCAFAQNNCQKGYKEVPGTNKDHTGKVVTPSQCKTTTTTKTSAQNNVNVGGNATIKVAGGNAGYSRTGGTTTTTTQTQKCTPEKTYYYKCESDKKDKDKK